MHPEHIVQLAYDYQSRLLREARSSHLARTHRRLALLRTGRRVEPAGREPTQL
jgi:hypothetical protein